MPRYFNTIMVFWNFNSLPNNKILDQSNFKALADDTLNVVQIITSDPNGIESIVGKGETDGYQHFLLFPPRF